MLIIKFRTSNIFEKFDAKIATQLVALAREFSIPKLGC